MHFFPKSPKNKMSKTGVRRIATGVILLFIFCADILRFMKFTKMQAAGNDYIYVNCFREKVKNPAKLAKLISDRHLGVGADGLILIMQSKKADVRMRIFNADGSEAEMCGNGIRCVAKYAYEHKLVKARRQKSLNIETGRDVLKVDLFLNVSNEVKKACVNMGQPILTPKDIPVNLPGEKIIEEPFEISGQTLLMTCVSMGNPHAVFFCDNVDSVELEKLGPAIENHKLFPNRVNVHFVQVLGRNEVKMRTWERGSGITLACGTGACACCVAAVLTNRCDRVCTAHLPGGNLELNWCEKDNCVYITGPAVEVFEGTWPVKR